MNVDKIQRCLQIRGVLLNGDEIYLTEVQFFLKFCCSSVLYGLSSKTSKRSREMTCASLYCIYKAYTANKMHFVQEFLETLQ